MGLRKKGVKMQDIKIDTKSIITKLLTLEKDELINSLNYIREELHKISPFKNEPVDFVKWVKNTSVGANDYNPNTVAPPEMELLRLSIANDGYTQPIVTWANSEKVENEVIDGFHRHRVGKECKDIQERIHGYLPIVAVTEDREGKNDRIASTIRHNRARGKHRVEAMADIVLDLKKRNWSDKKISTELGMDQDEVLRLSQITGLLEAFADKEFSEAWRVESLEDEE